MTGRTHLSEEEEALEREEREKLRHIDSKVHELRSRRSTLLTQVHQLSDEQKALYDQRAPKRQSLEAAHSEHRSIGRRLSELRSARDAARTRLDEALANLRLLRQTGPGDSRARPEAIQREMEQLELKQQTSVIPIAEENALITHLRQLRKQLEEANRDRAKVEGYEQKVKDAEEALKLRRVELSQLVAEGEKLRVERDNRMASMRAHLAEEGQLMAAMREKSKVRSEVMARLDQTSRELNDLEREGNSLVANQRSRRQEARKVITDYNRSVRSVVAGQSAYDRAAEEQLEQLLKRGRVTLGG
ncbi:MAG: hypothetical protein L3K09_01105 [Thermoplasmata archaeon]|nr:hypothetical protein [Thermoplasmata archaeon]